MPAREREHGELPSPDLSLFDRKVEQGLFVFTDGKGKGVTPIGSGQRRKGAEAGGWERRSIGSDRETSKWAGGAAPFFRTESAPHDSPGHSESASGALGKTEKDS